MQAGRPGGIRHPHAIGFAILALAVSSFCASCGEDYPLASIREVLSDGHENRTSAAFAMNDRPVRLELCMRVEGTSAIVEVDHPDGRTTETIEVAGPGIRELCKEFPKEPGSWGLHITAKGGNVAYWVALHDRKKYVGPDEDAKRFVEGD
jgi:hypothetical protein